MRRGRERFPRESRNDHGRQTEEVRFSFGKIVTGESAATATPAPCAPSPTASPPSPAPCSNRNPPSSRNAPQPQRVLPQPDHPLRPTPSLVRPAHHPFVPTCPPAERRAQRKSPRRGRSEAKHSALARLTERARRYTPQRRAAPQPPAARLPPAKKLTNGGESSPRERGEGDGTVDWDNRSDTFHNEWPAYRTREAPGEGHVGRRGSERRVPSTSRIVT